MQGSDAKRRKTNTGNPDLKKIRREIMKEMKNSMIVMNVKHLEADVKMTEASTKEEEDIMDAVEDASMTINIKKTTETTVTTSMKKAVGPTTTTTKMTADKISAVEVATTSEETSTIEETRTAAEEATITPGHMKIKTSITEAATTTEDRAKPLRKGRIATNRGSTTGMKTMINTSTKMNSTISRSTTEAMMIMSNLQGIIITMFRQGSRTATKPTVITMLP